MLIYNGARAHCLGSVSGRSVNQPSPPDLQRSKEVVSSKAPDFIRVSLGVTIHIVVTDAFGVLIEIGNVNHRGGCH